MEFLLDAFVEFFIELLCDPFLSLSSAFVPQKKLTEKTKRMIGYVLLIVSFSLFFWIDHRNFHFVQKRWEKLLGLVTYFFIFRFFTYRNDIKKSFSPQRIAIFFDTLRPHLSVGQMRPFCVTAPFRTAGAAGRRRSPARRRKAALPAPRG